MLVVDEAAFVIADKPYSIGREVWVQRKEGKLQAYKKVHNAFLMATKGDSFLPFYADAAESLLRRAEGPLVPQFAGPKLLTALHNTVGLNVQENAGMLSPLALNDICEGGGAALAKTISGHQMPLAAVNMSASLLGQDVDGVCNTARDYERAIELLLANGFPK